MKKRGFFVPIIISILLILSACGPQTPNEPVFADGVYEGTGKGFGGDVKVRVVVEDGEIKAVTVLEHQETEGISDEAIQKIPEAIINAQSYEVDVVSGATATSNAIMDAVKHALTGNGGGKNDSGYANDASADVLVIGGGGAGMVAAITAADNGANVILVEKMPGLGGNTITAATGLTASDTNLHKEAGIPFTVEDHVKRTMEVGKDLPDEKLVRILAESSNDAYEWLVSLGLQYRLNTDEPWWILPVEGHFGVQLVGAFKAELDKRADSVEIRLNTTATELIEENGKVTGAKVSYKGGSEGIIKAKAVILATGGFGNAPDLIGEYNPNYAGTHSVMSVAGVTGDGFRMALAVGAGTRDMEHYQMRPLATPGYWIRESVISQEGIGGILVNKDGQRFASETLRPLDLVPHVLGQRDRVAYVIFDADVAATNNGKAAIERGRMIQADTIEELAGNLSLDANTLRQTIADYNNGKDEFNRDSMGKVDVAPFYGVEVRPSPHYTMAGITVNEHAQVTNENGQPIDGLYAAGEIIGGLYGAGRVAGNNTTDTIVFGKIAGSSAAR